MNPETMYRATRIPSALGIVDVVLDTDAYNEVDDQYAIAYLLLLKNKFNTIGFTAAPFFNALSTSPEDGMNKSYDEILHILDLMGREDLKSHVYRGSTRWLPDEKTPVESDAARYLVEEARNHSPESPLHIIAIGAITNVASAILMDRSAMVNNTVITWLGGHGFHYSHTGEFNMRQDIPASRVLLDAGVNLTLIPCEGVASELRTTEPELRHWIKGQNALGDYLYEHTVEAAEKKHAGEPWSRVIWDVAAVAALRDRGSCRFVKSRMETTPDLRDDFLYAPNENKHPLRYVFKINRDEIFNELFRLIREMGKEETK
ncbi:MAG: nucleoside hydrolase [Clostridia bacterium]|nr:nucleoside hydrolase [Clostridia bacterium]